MHAHLFLLTGALLLAPAVQPRAEHLLAGPLGIAQQASLRHVDVLVDLARNMPPELASRLRIVVSSAQRAHEIAVRNLIVVERGRVTADYRRWKLRRAVSALVRADEERERVLRGLLAAAPSDAVPILEAASEQARAETTLAVNTLRSLDGGAQYGGAGGGAGFQSQDPSKPGEKTREGRGKDRAAIAGAPTPPCR